MRMLSFIVIGLIAGGIWGGSAGYSPSRSWTPDSYFGGNAGSQGASVDSQKLGEGLLYGAGAGLVLGWLTAGSSKKE